MSLKTYNDDFVFVREVLSKDGYAISGGETNLGNLGFFEREDLFAGGSDDFGFLLGILMFWPATGSVAFSGIEQNLSDVTLHPAHLTAACLLVLCGTIGKSAQMPLHEARGRYCAWQVLFLYRH